VLRLSQASFASGSEPRRRARPNKILGFGREFFCRRADLLRPRNEEKRGPRKAELSGAAEQMAAKAAIAKLKG